MKNTINVLGYNIKIVLKDLSEEGLMGYYDHTNRVIYLEKTLPKGELQRTFLHEVGHAITCTTGIRFSGGLSPELEEVIVESYANAILQLKEKRVI